MAIGGDILIKMAADVAELRSGFQEAQRSAAETAESFKRLSEIAEKVFNFEIVREGISKLLEMAEAVGKIREQAEKLQVSTDQFQGLADVALRSGLSVEDMSTAMTRLNRNIGEAGLGNKQAIQQFDTLGVRLLDVTGKLRGTADVSAEVARKILEIDDPAKRTALTIQEFGRGGASMLPVLEKLAQGADSAAESLNARGGMISEETIGKFNQLSSAVASTARVIEAMGATIVANLIFDPKPILDEIEGIGRAIVSVLDTPTLHGISKFFDDAAIAQLKSTREEIDGLAEVIRNFGPIFQVGMQSASVATGQWVLSTITFFNDVAQAAAGIAERVANFFIHAFNEIQQSFAQDMNRLKQATGIGTPEIPLPQRDIKIDFKVVGADTVKKTTDEVTAAQDRLTKATANLAQIRMADAEAAARQGKLPVSEPGAGVGQPLAKPTGGTKAEPRDRVAEALDELRRRQAGEEGLLADLKAYSIDVPMREIDRQIDLQKKINDMVASVAKKQPGGATPELVKQITDQVTATEAATFAVKNYREAMNLADETEKKYGNGATTFREAMSKLNDAFTTGRLGQDAYNEATKRATEAQQQQMLTARGQKEGIDGLTAGFELAAVKWAEHNDAFSLGGEAFTGTINLMTSTLGEFATGADVSFNKVLQSFISMLAQMALKWAAAEFIQFLLPAGGGKTGGGGTFADVGSLIGSLGLGGDDAKGGPVYPGQMYRVGEQGPEYFAPTHAGSIMTGQQMLGSQGPTVVQTLNFSLGVQQTVRAEVMSMMGDIAAAGAAQAQRNRERGGRYKQSWQR